MDVNDNDECTTSSFESVELFDSYNVDTIYDWQ